MTVDGVVAVPGTADLAVAHWNRCPWLRELALMAVNAAVVVAASTCCAAESPDVEDAAALWSGCCDAAWEVEVASQPPTLP